NPTEEPAILESFQIDSAKDKMESIASKSLASLSIVIEFIQYLLEELFLSGSQPLKSIKFFPSKTIVSSSIDIKRLANLFSQADSARKKLIIAKSEDKKLANKTASTQIYAKIKLYLTDISDEYLCVRTSKARKINKLFGFEYDSITLNKVKSKRITDQSCENEIALTIVNISANDPNSNDNF
ncbi:8655_t:CDS:2, partial [Funneliformis geosporum]